MAASVINAKFFTSGTFKLGLRLAKSTRRNGFLDVNVVRSLRFYSEKNDKPDVKETSDRISAVPPVLIAPSTYDKIILVWTKKYPSMKDVPDRVPGPVIQRAQNKALIYKYIIAMLFSLVAGMFMLRKGYNAHMRGESVQSQRLEMYRKYKEEGK